VLRVKTITPLKKGAYLGYDMSYNKQKKELSLGLPHYWGQVKERYPDVDVAKHRAGPCKGPPSDFFKVSESSPPCDLADYRSKVQYLMYGACNLQWVALPYCIFLSTVSNPTVAHMERLNHILAWCYQQRDVVKVINPKSTEISMLADASFAILPDGGSIGAYIVLMGGCPIYAKCFKVRPLPTSSTESEFTTLNEAGRTAEYVRNWRTEIHLPPKGPMDMGQDNQSTMTLAVKETGVFKRSRHALVRYAYVRELVKNGIIRLVYIPTDKMLADVLTKPMAGKKFWDFYKALGFVLRRPKSH
jgi:hypothetical protein